MSNIQSFREATAAFSGGFMRADRNTEQPQVFGDTRFFGKVASWMKNPGAEGNTQGGVVFVGNRDLKEKFLAALGKEYGAKLGKDVMAEMERLVDPRSDTPLSVRTVKQLITDGDKRLADRDALLKDPAYKNTEAARKIGEQMDSSVSRTGFMAEPLKLASVSTRLDARLDRMAVVLLADRTRDLGEADRRALLEPATDQERSTRTMKLDMIKAELLTSTIDGAMAATVKTGLLEATHGGAQKVTFRSIGGDSIDTVVARAITAGGERPGEGGVLAAKAAILDSVDAWPGASEPEKLAAKLAALRGDAATPIAFLNSYFPEDVAVPRGRADAEAVTGRERAGGVVG